MPDPAVRRKRTLCNENSDWRREVGYLGTSPSKNMTTIEDLSGEYNATQGEATLIGSAGTISMKNRANNVGLLRLYSRYGPSDRSATQSATQGDLCHEAPVPPVTQRNRSSASGPIDNYPGGTLL